MNSNAKWQKFYKWYCIVSCMMVGMVYMLTLLGDAGWGAQHEWLHNFVRNICGALFVTTITGMDTLLWLISLCAGFSHRQSTRLGQIIGLGLAMLVAKLLNCAFYIVLTDNMV